MSPALMHHLPGLHAPSTTAYSVFDHMDYHRQARNTRKQCFKEGQRVSKTQRKRRNIAINKQKKVGWTFWDHQAAGSNPVTRTKNPLKSSISEDFSMQKVQISYVVKTALSVPEPAYFIDYCGAEFAPACVLRQFVANGKI